MKLGKYNLIKSLADFLWVDKYLTDNEFTRFAIDSETNGLRTYKDVVVGFSFSVDAESGFYVPLLTWKPDPKSLKTTKKDGDVYTDGCFECFWTQKEYPEDVTQDDYTPPDFIRNFFKRWFFDKEPDLIMHNAPFDCLMLEASMGVDIRMNVLCDTVLLKHVLDENTSMGLKETAILWQKELGIPVDEEANKEQIVLGASIRKNGGTYNKRTKHVWRAGLEEMYTYAVADTFLTMGVFNVGMDKFLSEYEERHWQWFFQDEVMPLCREVVIPMKKRGIRINVPHFQEMEVETHGMLQELEENIIGYLSENKLLEGFTKGKSVEEIVTKKKLIKEIIKLEGLTVPITTNKKGVSKETFARKAIEAAYNKEPHWVWGYLLGEDELKYSVDRLNELKKEIYIREEGRRYQFNIQSDQHLRWLFFSKLKNDADKFPKTDGGAPSVDAENMENLLVPKYPWLKDLLLYKKLNKLYGTYIRPANALNHNGYLYMEMMQHGTISGRFACGGGYNLQTLPKVEDCSKCYKCGSKNLTNVNPIKVITVMYCNDCEHMEEVVCYSAIKEGFIAPEGKKIIAADYSSLEPRCFAMMSGDPKLKEVYQQDLDLYSKVYCDMEDPEGVYSADPKAPNFLKKMDPAKRDMVKPVVLGIPYGARDGQVANLMNFRKSVMKDGEVMEFPDVERGKQFRDKFLATYKNLKQYMVGSEADANGRGFVETIVGRRRHFRFAPKVFKLIAKSNMDYEEFLDEKNKYLAKTTYKGFLNKDGLTQLSNELGFALYDVKKKKARDWGFVRAFYKNELNNAKNFRIQGLGAHITNKGMLDINRALKAAGLDAWVCLQVHDEIILYGDETKTQEIGEIVRKGMEINQYTALVDVPMIAAPVIANNLKEAK